MSLLEQLPQSNHEAQNVQTNAESRQLDLKEEFGAAFLIEDSKGDIVPMWLTGFASDQLPSYALHGNNHEEDHAYELIDGSVSGSEEEGYSFNTRIVSAEQLSPDAQQLMRRRLEIASDEQRKIAPGNPEELLSTLEQLRQQRARKSGGVALRLLGSE